MTHGAVGWAILAEKGKFPERTYEEAPLEGFHGLTMHMMPGGKREDVHEHTNKEQVYYFTEGRGKLVLGDQTLDVRDGDAADRSGGDGAGDGLPPPCRCISAGSI